MEYHEIGERFVYNGVVLEVIQVPFCSRCYFHGKSICKLVDEPKYCSIDSRNDNKSISYKLAGYAILTLVVTHKEKDVKSGT